MAPVEAPGMELDEKYVDNIAKLVSDVRSGKLSGPTNIASATLTLLEQIITDLQTASAYSLCTVVRSAGSRLARALPLEPVCANTARRVLRAIRDVHHQSGEGCGESLQRLVRAAPARRATISDTHDLRETLREHIAELRQELEYSMSAVCATAREHVHSAELILAHGHVLVERFLRGCAQRNVRVLLPASPQHKQSAGMAARLATAGAPVTVISEAAVFAVMSRVNKVVLGVRAALAGGGALADAGTLAITAAAKHHSVPVVALAPLCLLTPTHARAAPPACAPPADLSASICAPVHVVSPQLDLIPADHITLYITNLGGSSPSYIYRLLSELYDPEDYEL